MLFCIVLILCILPVATQNITASGLIGRVLQQDLSRPLTPLTNLLSKTASGIPLLEHSTLQKLVEKVLELLKPLLPFVNLLLKQVTQILILVINNLGDFLQHLVLVLNALLPDWKNILHQLLKTVLELLKDILPELLPLLKEVLNVVQGLLQFLFDGNLCDVDQLFEKLTDILN
uniref:Uncharacterized protein LOC111137844 n=1 Tax=Crassostrea virginica TaxID=6565 RepID=A0A8B8EYW9_CRAVI|nr:uncharacterized protein LOC111137844 [Crassostrea virginica]